MLSLISFVWENPSYFNLSLFAKNACSLWKDVIGISKFLKEERMSVVIDLA